MFCWFIIAVIFAGFYFARGGIISKLPTSSLPQSFSYFIECFYFSIVTAVTPGYGKYELTSWEYQVVASIEDVGSIHCHFCQEVHEMNAIVINRRTGQKRIYGAFKQISISLGVENFGQL
jgi:hypothetical protein